MTFEVGKFYEHTTGLRYAILCEAKTTMWGDCLLAETDDADIVAVGKEESATINFTEITEAEWLQAFKED